MELAFPVANDDHKMEINPDIFDALEKHVIVDNLKFGCHNR